jgi:outer membrane receptor protein involved in Fe transport
MQESSPGRSTTAFNPLVRAAVRDALKGAMLTGAVAATAAAPSAQAQVMSSADASTDASLQEVIVTGSRIRQPALEAVSPVTTVSTIEIQQSGTTRIEDLLNQLPQVVADMGSNISDGATGAATVSLRGLGSQRTMVLIDGRRLMPGDPTQNGVSSPDLNQIPEALVERVDVLTGGASSVYGADAVAGVVNFIMNDHFEGVRLDVNGSFYNHSQHEGDKTLLEQESGFATAPPGSVNDGQSKDITAILGGNFADGRGNATVYLGYRVTNPVLQSKRDFSACALTYTSSVKACGGSLTASPAIFSLGGNYYTIGAGNNVVPASFAGAGNSLYNYAPLNYFQRDDQRYTGGAFAHYDFNDHATAFLQFMFMDDRTDAQVGPSGAFYGSGTGVTGGVPDATWVVNCSNPYLSASELANFCGGSTAGDAHLTFGRRNTEGDPRSDDLGHTSFRTVLGLKGNIDDAWSYNTYFLSGITRYSEEYNNDVSANHIANALQAVSQTVNGVTSVVCAANANGANGAPGCVPWNIFQLGGVTPAQVAYLQVPAESKGFTQENIWEGTLTADLGKHGIKLPTASHGLGVSVGADWRSEKTVFQPDYEYIINDLSGQGSPDLPTSGSFNVWEAYGEARLPILEDQPFAKSLAAEVGYRYSEYNLSFGSTNTWKAGLEWAPVADFRLRGMYNVAVRAPNAQELYLQQRVQLDGSIDPCAGPTPTASAAQCARSGVTTAEYGNIAANPSNQYNGLIGGNTALKPETADTLTFGVVFTPTFLPTLDLTLDYYDIKIKNVISSYGANLIIQDCVDTGDPFYCSLVHRAPATGSAGDGSLWIGTSGYISDGTYNLGEQTAQGLDLGVEYKLDAGRVGRFTLGLEANYDLHFKTTPVPGGGTYDCAGYYGDTCGVPAPHVKSRFRVSWNTPVKGLDTWLNWRFVGPVDVENLSQNPLLSGAVAPTGYDLGNHIPGYNYLDLGVSYQVLKQLTARVGVNNLLDKDPPIVEEAYTGNALLNGNTFPQVYDTLGRYIFLNLTADF